VVTRYLEAAGLLEDLEAIGFSLVGYGCTTCIGNSGPLPDDVSTEIDARGLVVGAFSDQRAADVVHDDAGALSREPERLRASDPAPGAGDDRDRAVERTTHGRHGGGA